MMSNIFLGKIIVLIFATYFYEKKVDNSLRKTGSSWEKMSIPNLSVQLLNLILNETHSFIIFQW